MENNIYTRQFSDEEIKIVEHFVLDFNQWIEDAINGKINSCRKRIMKDEWDQAIENGSPLPQSKDELISNCFAQLDYKNRKQREENDQSTPTAL